MSPAQYAALPYEQKLLYVREVFHTASSKHPVYQKMYTLLTGWVIQEKYLDMLYDTINTIIMNQNDASMIWKLENLTEILEDIRIREQADRLAEQSDLKKLEEAIMAVG